MKKWLKIVLYSLLGLTVIAGSVIGYFYYDYEGKYDVNSKKHKHSIGYLPPSNRDFYPNFSRCSDNKPIGYYSSAGKNVYANDKITFKRNILSNFKNTNYSDTGFLNLRFIINCKGEVGDMEINELNENYEPTVFNKEMVEDLVLLTVKKDNWNNLGKEASRDVYMYIIYKLKNGEIIKILP